MSDTPDKRAGFFQIGCHAVVGALLGYIVGALAYCATEPESMASRGWRGGGADREFEAIVQVGPVTAILGALLAIALSLIFSAAATKDTAPKKEHAEPAKNSAKGG